MTTIQRRSPEEIRDLRARNPEMRERDFARIHKISEAELVAAHIGHGVTRLRVDVPAALNGLAACGEVMALTRNDSAVHEKIGPYENVNLGAHAGTVLGKDDLELAPVSLKTADAGGYAALDQLVGKQLVRQSRVGVMLKPSDVADPTVVTRNALVTVQLSAGAMTLTVKGQALGSAAAGEPVDVFNTVTRKILRGIARADGVVTIPTATTVASL